MVHLFNTCIFLFFLRTEGVTTKIIEGGAVEIETSTKEDRSKMDEAAEIIMTIEQQEESKPAKEVILEVECLNISFL